MPIHLSNVNCRERTEKKIQPVCREDLYPAHFSTLNFSFNSHLAITLNIDLGHAEARGKESYQLLWSQVCTQFLLV